MTLKTGWSLEGERWQSERLGWSRHAKSIGKRYSAFATGMRRATEVRTFVPATTVWPSRASFMSKAAMSSVALDVAVSASTAIARRMMTNPRLEQSLDRTHIVDPPLAAQLQR